MASTIENECNDVYVFSVEWDLLREECGFVSTKESVVGGVSFVRDYFSANGSVESVETGEYVIRFKWGLGL